jgi:hypothetical protein
MERAPGYGSARGLLLRARGRLLPARGRLLPARGRLLLAGIVSGAATSVGFAALHHLLISDIWFSLGPMTAAGALCGLTLAWSYSLLAGRPSPGGWLLYNLGFVALFVLLGLISLLVYEPRYTIPGLVAGVEPPDVLLREALPLTLGFGLLSGVGLSAACARQFRAGAAVVVTSLTLTLLLGHNAAILGMVHMTKEALPLLAEFYGLIAAIMAGNAGVFFLLERRGFFGAA